MTFTLKQFDNKLFSFTLTETFSGVECIIDKNSFFEENSYLLPLDLSTGNKLPSNDELISWLKHRTIPSNRRYVQNFLAKLGLNEKNTIGILSVCYALSLTDCYWVCPDFEKRTFKDLNLFENKFSKVLSLIAFTGYGSYTKSTFRSSPEFTTNGMLAKAWHRINGDIILYKSGTEGAANTGNEPYSEFYASQIAKKMELNSISYGLSMWQKRLCSTCSLFTSFDYSYIPAGNIIKSGGIKAVLEYYQKLGKDFYNELLDMFVYDAIILNTDRHLGNFGFLIDNHINKIVKPAPIFDNGLSLFCYAMEDDLKNINLYEKTLVPALYNDFIEFSKKIITDRQKEKLRKLIGFKFTKNTRYNLPQERIKIIEKQIQLRLETLLV